MPQSLPNHSNIVSIPSTLFNPTSQAHDQLATQHRLLHLLHHRNRNQHRRSTWYRHFNLFRREVRNLCVDLGIDLGAGFNRPKPSASKAITRPGAKSSGTQSQIAKKQTRALPRNKEQAKQRLTHWVEGGLVVRWYTAFTTLTTTPSFSPLALTLVAILARVCGLTGISAHLHTLAHEEEKVEESEGDATLEDVGVPQSFAVERVEGSAKDEKQDVGVVLARDEVIALEADKVARRGRERERRRRERKLPKKQNENPIDELFGGIR